jgi:hypothetical protein
MNIFLAGRFLQFLCILIPSLFHADPVCCQDFASAKEDEFTYSTYDTSRVYEIQKPDKGSPVREQLHVQDMLVNVPGDWASSAAVTVDARALPYIAGVGAVTGLLIATDKQTNDFAKRITANSDAVQNASRTFVHVGDGKTHLAVAAGFALYGLIGSDSRALRTGSQTVEALLSCGIAVQVLKRCFGRESPQVATSDRGVWRFFPNLKSYQKHQAKYYAFPSGHISTTMATVTVIAENYPDISWIRPVGYSLIGCLGVSLVNVGYHWYSDLPLGIAMGYMFGMIASHQHGGGFAFLGNDAYSGLRVLPVVSQEGTGVTLALLF